MKWTICSIENIIINEYYKFYFCSSDSCSEKDLLEDTSKRFRSEYEQNYPAMWAAQVFINIYYK